MKREQFVARLRRYCRKNGLTFAVDYELGKGSHAAVFAGDRRTIVKSGEITPKEMRNMLKQLGLPHDALE
jgi:hypothetical protein